MFLVDTKYEYTDTVTNHQTFINSRFVWKQGAEGGRRRMMRRWRRERRGWGVMIFRNNVPNFSTF